MNSISDPLIAVLENTSDAFFALNNTWQFTYINYKAALLLHRTITVESVEEQDSVFSFSLLLQ